MSRRKEANRAEAIVRAVGALIMLALLLGMVFAMPHIAKGKNVHEIMQIIFSLLFCYVLLGMIIGVIGLVVRWRRSKDK